MDVNWVGPVSIPKVKLPGQETWKGLQRASVEAKKGNDLIGCGLVGCLRLVVLSILISEPEELIGLDFGLLM